MLERLLIALVIIVFGVIVWHVYNRWTLQRLAARPAVDPLLVDVQTGSPVVVYFSTPFCVSCRTQQQPVLQALKADLGEALRIIHVDAAQETDAADRWGVFSAPTTFVLDGDFRPRFINRGVASHTTLRGQLLELMRG